MIPEKELDLVILIADLSGYTALTEAHGNIRAANVVTRYVEIATGLLPPAVRLLERVGDELVIVAQGAADVVRTAVMLHQAVEREPFFPTVRSGIHAGSVVEQGQSYFGSGLNLASRVAAYARSGQILCTERVKVLARTLNDVEYRDLGLVRFKNIRDPQAIFEVVGGLPNSEGTAVDPVCRMQVRPDTAPARLPVSGRTYYFCSFDCAQAFAQSPDHYLDRSPVT